MPKQLLLKIVLVLYVVLSLVYISVDAWGSFRTNTIERSFAQGRREAILQLIEQSEKCQPVSVFADEKQAQVVNVTCLQQGSPQQAQPKA
ncbi:MAG: hypothetical protein HY538_05430, partial [Deltaproteobacteria bacterium]|nr:hypothetical protein [Deltaproteobacteria bacterium]